MKSTYPCTSCAGSPYRDEDDEIEWCDDCNRCGRCCLRAPRPTCDYVPEEPPAELAEFGPFCPLTSISAGKEWSWHVYERDRPPPPPPYFNPITGERIIRGRVLSKPVFYTDDGRESIFFTLGTLIDSPDGQGAAIHHVDVLLEGRTVSILLRDLAVGDDLCTICREQLRWVRPSDEDEWVPLRVHVGESAQMTFLDWKDDDEDDEDDVDENEKGEEVPF